MKLIIQHLAQAALETTKSLAGAQVANAIHKITSMINSNDGQDLAVGKVVVDNEAKCSTSAAPLVFIVTLIYVFTNNT